MTKKELKTEKELQKGVREYWTKKSGEWGISQQKRLMYQKYAKVAEEKVKELEKQLKALGKEKQKTKNT